MDGYAAFVPDPLPPVLTSSWPLSSRLAAAEYALGALQGIGRTLPNPHLLIAPFARREAVLSSRIEGTNATVGELLLFEASGTPGEVSDVREVSNYVQALNYGLQRLKDLPFSLRFLREVHRILMTGVRGADRRPGEFRTVQNWIGSRRIDTATYVPPPVVEMHAALDAFEKYAHAPSDLPLLVRCALLHYQFEAIHPFLDGNGRLGRLIIPFLLREAGALDQPILYLSAFFETHREHYMSSLLEVSTRGAWNEWIEFFLRAIEVQANDAIQRADALLRLWQQVRASVSNARNSALIGAIVDRLFDTPAITISGIVREFGISYPAAKKNVEKLVAANILEEPREKGRNLVYRAPRIIALVDA